MPELPEVEIAARRLDAALRGARIASARAPGVNTLRTIDPPLEALVGQQVEDVRRRGKLLIVDVGALALLVHLMSAGRLELRDRPASPRDRGSRLLVGLDDGRELRLRELGTRQRAWAKLLAADDLVRDEALARLGPEAWPDPPDLEALLAGQGDRPLHSTLRDQRVIAGIGRAWVDEILWSARLSPFQRAGRLTGEQARTLREAIAGRLGDAIDRYEREQASAMPERGARALEVHGRAGEPCPRCDGRLEAVHYEDYVLCYCPAEQTGGRVLKDRRLSRLLK